MGRAVFRFPSINSVAILIFICLVALPLVTSSRSAYSMVNMIAISGVFALSYNILVGYTGILSLGHALFFGSGAYIVGVTMRHLGPSLPMLGLAIFGALIFAVAAGLFAGYLTLRLKAIYYAMITLALAELFVIFAEKWRDLTGGWDGLNYKVPVAIREPVAVYYLVLAFTAAVVLFTRRFLDSPTGKVIVAIRENEQRASSLGFNVFRYKLIASVVAGVISSLSGVVFALESRFVMTGILSVEKTLEALLMTIIGGMGTLFGPLIGAAVVHLTGDWLAEFAKIHPIFERWPILFGFVYIFIVLAVPGGVMTGWNRLAQWVATKSGPGKPTKGDRNE